MSHLDELLAAAADFAARFPDDVDANSLSISPRKGVVIVTCVDPRVDPTHVFALAVGDAIVARTPGGRVTAELLDDLQTAAAVGARKPDVKRPLTDVLVVHHTECGFTGIADPEMRATIRDEISGDAGRMEALAIESFETSLAADVALVRGDARFRAPPTVTGWLYDVATGQLQLVVEPA